MKKKALIYVRIENIKKCRIHVLLMIQINWRVKYDIESSRKSDIIILHPKGSHLGDLRIKVQYEGVFWGSSEFLMRTSVFEDFCCSGTPLDKKIN